MPSVTVRELRDHSFSNKLSQVGNNLELAKGLLCETLKGVIGKRRLVHLNKTQKGRKHELTRIQAAFYRSLRDSKSVGEMRTLVHQFSTYMRSKRNSKEVAFDDGGNTGTFLRVLKDHFGTYEGHAVQNECANRQTGEIKKYDWQAGLTKLHDARKPVDPDSIDLSTVRFKEGGVHKSVALREGVLKSNDKTGSEDFDREEEIDRIANEATKNNDERLKRFVSTQTRIASPCGGDPSCGYATFPVYKEGIKVASLNDYLKELNPEKALNVLIQVFRALQAMHVHNIAHLDFHAENIIIVEINSEPYVQVIDFGKMKSGKDFAAHGFADIEYLFQQKSHSRGDRLKRGFRKRAISAGYSKWATNKKLAKCLRVNEDKQRKHYPLHQLLAQIYPDTDKRILNQFLHRTGDRLIKDLKFSGDDKALQERAFERCANTLLRLSRQPR